MTPIWCLKLAFGFASGAGPLELALGALLAGALALGLENAMERGWLQIVLAVCLTLFAFPAIALVATIGGGLVMLALLGPAFLKSVAPHVAITGACMALMPPFASLALYLVRGDWRQAQPQGRVVTRP